MKILITGANGFVGTALIETLLKEGHEIVALSRQKKKSTKKTKLTWIQGDLLEPESLPQIEKFDKAFYLVHGLKDNLESFEYHESLAAVHFINWIRPSGAEIVYLGALGPKTTELSPHLRSRQLTGAILGASGLGVTEFRASIILGEGSLSFEMIKAMVHRFPFRPDLKVLDSPSQPLSLEDLLKYLTASLNHHPKGHEVIEIGAPEIATYGELLDLYAELAGLIRIKVKIPEVDNKIILKALDYTVPEHADIGKKLTISLEHPTIVTDDSARRIFPDIHPMSLREAMNRARVRSKTRYAPLWEKDFLKDLLSDKILASSGLLTPELIKSFLKRRSS